MFLMDLFTYLPEIFPHIHVSGLYPMPAGFGSLLQGTDYLQEACRMIDEF